MKRLLRYLLCVFLALPLLFCTKETGRVNHGNYPAAIDKIIANNCAVSGCHNSSSYLAAGSFNLQTWKDVFSGSGNGSPVIPYSSRFSSLCYFINTYSDLGTQNSPTMPVNKKALSYDEVKEIKDWIDNGAPDMNGNVMWTDDPLRKKLYLVNQGCDVVTVLDAETQLPIRYVDVGTRPDIESPHQVRVSPDGKYWYVIFVSNNIMQKFRCSDDSYVGKIPLTKYAAGISTDPLSDALNWNSMIISSDSKRAYCASLQTGGRLCAVDLENMKFLHDLPALDNPHGVALNAAQDKIYVTAQYRNYITEIDTGFANGSNELSIENGVPPLHSGSNLPEPHDIILSADGNNFLISCQNTNEVRVFNIASGSVTAVVPAGTYPQEIVYSKTLNQYFVSCTNDTDDGANGTVLRIDGANYAHAKIKCGYQPHGIAVDESKKLLYVLSRNISSAGPPPHHTSQCQGKNGFVNFVDLNTFSLLTKKYELSVDPYFISARP